MERSASILTSCLIDIPVGKVCVLEWLSTISCLHYVQGNPILPDEIQSRQKASQSVHYELPKNWTKKDLSPSLLPPPRKGYDWSNVGQWG